MMNLRYPDVPIKWNQRFSFFELEIDSAVSEIWIGGIDDKERFDKILGKEFATIYCNEVSEIGYDIWTALRSRLAQVVDCPLSETGTLSQRMYADMNPTSSAHWSHKLWKEGIDPADGSPVEPGDYAWGQMNPRDNPHLTPEYLQSLQDMPERERRRFWDGEYAADALGALWTREMIRYSPTRDVPDNLVRVIVSVDPSVSTETMRDECGLVVLGIDQANIAYVLEDASARMAPNEWARRAINLYDEYSADCIVAESNQGGEMVRMTIQSEDSDTHADKRPPAPVKLVNAWRGKVLRAEPIASLYGRGKVVHRMRFPLLEDQMCSLTPDFDRTKAGYSPDRVDATVHGLTELFPHIAQRAGASRRQGSRQGQRGVYSA